MGGAPPTLSGSRGETITTSALVSVAAQGLSSASNLVAQVGLALTLAPVAFGSLVVGFSVYYFALALVRALVGDPLVALVAPGRLTDGGGERGSGRIEAVDKVWRRVRGRLVAISGLATALVTVTALAAGSVRVELALLAAAVPILLTQDAYRYLAWARGRPKVVLALDGVWVISSLALVLAAALGLGTSAVTGAVILFSWCGGGLTSALLARRLLPILPPPRPQPGAPGPANALDDDPDPVDRPDDLVRSLSWTQAILAVDANGLPVVVAAVAGATVSAGLRVVTLPFMPITTAVVALRVLALPRLHEAVRIGQGRLVAARVALIFASVGVGASGAMLGLLAFLPDRWLGPSGQLVEPWFVLGAVIVVGRVINLPLSDVLALGADRRGAMACRLGASILSWTATIGGAVLFGLQGAIMARAGASIVSILIWAVAVVRATEPGGVERSRRFGS
ncbi:MAG: hypothetical protein GY773_12090 [Actinomycetia bacterium]|nr:hypothetical protein [Actinomycetes bacterium]